MTTNVGTTDRVLRLGLAALAAVAAALVGIGTAAGVGLVVVGLVLLGTAATGTCPLYRLLGVSTCRVAHR